MISVRRAGEGLVVDLQLPSPCVYLDYAGIGVLAKDSALGSAFQEALLQAGGTLYLSWAHLLELYGLGTGPTYEGIKSYLAGFGQQFVMMDCDSNSVIGREVTYRRGEQVPCVDVDFIKVIASNWESSDPLSIAVLLNLVDGAPSLLDSYKRMHRDHREGTFKIFEQARDTYRNDRQAKKALDSKQYMHVPGSPPTQYIRDQLQRETIRSQDKLKPNEGLDFEHSVVALAYCDHLVLDKQWAARVGRFPESSPMARVWKVGQLKALVGHLRV